MYRKFQENFLRSRVKKVCYVLFLGNRGLCGAYNSSILHYANSVIKQGGKDYGLVVCGRWGKDVLANSRLNVIKTFAELSDTPNIDEALEVADYLKGLFTSGEYDEVHLIYQHYVTALRQDATCSIFLPRRRRAKIRVTAEYSSSSRTRTAFLKA